MTSLHVPINKSVENKDLGLWFKFDATETHSFDRFCQWNDKSKWDDSRIIYDTPEFKLTLKQVG